MPLDPADIVKAHAAWLRTVLSSRVQEKACIDDLMQEVFLAVVRQRDELDRVEKLEPWLYRIAVRAVLQHRRKMGRYRKRLEDYWLQQSYQSQPDAVPDPLSWVIHDEATTLMTQALQHLRPSDREVLLLKHAHGWTYREIAEHLGASLSTVEYRISRARDRLRRLIHTSTSTEVSK